MHNKILQRVKQFITLKIISFEKISASPHLFLYRPAPAPYFHFPFLTFQIPPYKELKFVAPNPFREEDGEGEANYVNRSEFLRLHPYMDIPKQRWSHASKIWVGKIRFSATWKSVLLKASSGEHCAPCSFVLFVTLRDTCVCLTMYLTFAKWNRLWKDEYWNKFTYSCIHQNDLIDMEILRNIEVLLVSSLLTLKRFHTFS